MGHTAFGSIVGPMVDRPLVSIVTPTLNQGRFIEATIRSIKTQSYDRFEHIVVDGGSTDETLEILRRHEGTYPLRWLSEPDRGMYEAVNKGMRLASGDILAYLNSDDLYFPWTLEAAVAAFDRHRDADFVFGDALVIDDASGRQDFYWTLPFNLDYIRRYGFLAQPTVFWRQAAFAAIGPFDESLRYVADCDYWMRAGALHKFLKLNEFLAVERNHSSTLRESEGSGVWGELEKVRSRYVLQEGRPHEKMMRRHRLSSRLWYRTYWLGLLIQSFVPKSVRRGPWTRLLAASGDDVRRARLLLRPIPRIGRAISGQVLRASRHWLEPPDA